MLLLNDIHSPLNRVIDDYSCTPLFFHSLTHSLVVHAHASVIRKHILYDHSRVYIGMMYQDRLYLSSDCDVD